MKSREDWLSEHTTICIRRDTRDLVNALRDGKRIRTADDVLNEYLPKPRKAVRK